MNFGLGMETWLTFGRMHDVVHVPFVSYPTLYSLTNSKGAKVVEVWEASRTEIYKAFQ